MARGIACETSAFLSTDSENISADHWRHNTFRQKVGDFEQ